MDSRFDNKPPQSDGPPHGPSAPGTAGAHAQKLAVGVPLSRIIPRQLVDSPEVVMRSAARSIAAERFRRLKTLVEHNENGPNHVIVVTSATPGEGKSLVSLNLALAFASDKKEGTLLIDADLRRPRVEDWITPEPSLGLSEILSGQADPDHAILDLKENALHVLPAGHPPGDPVDLLASQYFGALLASFRKRFERIIIDTPPILPFTDADLIGRHSDGILLVTRYGITPKSLYQRAVAAVTSTRILGTVLNDLVQNLADSSHYYDGYYSRYYDQQKSRRTGK
jgi:capsular exopolysaccharide synthesis family protein